MHAHTYIHACAYTLPMHTCIHAGGQLCRLCDCRRLSCYSVHLGNTHQCQNCVFSCYRQQAWSLQRGLHCTVLHHNATHCNILQRTATRCNTISKAQSLPRGHAHAHAHTRTHAHVNLHVHTLVHTLVYTYTSVSWY